jgi:CTP:molybdopterin cytidylyltransferase MocA
MLAAGVAYVGVLGPRRRTLRMIEDLGSAEETSRLYAPVGLDIGAETPDEIALAIVAEVLAVKSRRRGAPLRERPGGIHDESLTDGAPDGTGPVAAVVLAAGGSARLGRPKQLVVHEGLPLVARAALAALETGADPVIVVLGADAPAVRAVLSGIPVIPVVNSEWSGGMGTSLAAGVRAMMEHAPSARAVLVMLADQPMVGGATLRRLVDTWAESDARSGNGGLSAAIAAAAYEDTTGVPAIFGRAHFDALCSLPATSGAARLLRGAEASVSRVPMPEAAIDIDTPDDLERLLPEGLDQSAR